MTETGGLPRVESAESLKPHPPMEAVRARFLAQKTLGQDVYDSKKTSFSLKAEQVKDIVSSPTLPLTDITTASHAERIEAWGDTSFDSAYQSWSKSMVAQANGDTNRLDFLSTFLGKSAPQQGEKTGITQDDINKLYTSYAGGPEQVDAFVKQMQKLCTGPDGAISHTLFDKNRDAISWLSRKIYGFDTVGKVLTECIDGTVSASDETTRPQLEKDLQQEGDVKARLNTPKEDEVIVLDEFSRLLNLAKTLSLPIEKPEPATPPPTEPAPAPLTTGPGTPTGGEPTPVEPTTTPAHEIPLTAEQQQEYDDNEAKIQKIEKAMADFDKRLKIFATKETKAGRAAQEAELKRLKQRNKELKPPPRSDTDLKSDADARNQAEAAKSKGQMRQDLGLEPPPTPASTPVERRNTINRFDTPAEVLLTAQIPGFNNRTAQGEYNETVGALGTDRAREHIEQYTEGKLTVDQNGNVIIAPKTPEPAKAPEPTKATPPASPEVTQSATPNDEEEAARRQLADLADAEAREAARNPNIIPATLTPTAEVDKQVRPPFQRDDPRILAEKRRLDEAIANKARAAASSQDPSETQPPNYNSELTKSAAKIFATNIESVEDFTARKSLLSTEITQALSNFRFMFDNPSNTANQIVDQIDTLIARTPANDRQLVARVVSRTLSSLIGNFYLIQSQSYDSKLDNIVSSLRADIPPDETSPPLNSHAYERTAQHLTLLGKKGCTGQEAYIMLSFWNQIITDASSKTKT